jgi:hypothetical protein
MSYLNPNTNTLNLPTLYIYWYLSSVAILCGSILLVVVVAEQEIEDKALICLSSLLSACPLSPALLH